MEGALVRAANPSPYTLDGTNTWVVGRDPAWVVDPGPALDGHLDAVAAAVAERGGAGGIALTHDHADHAEGLPGLRARLGDPPVGAWPALGDGGRFGPFTALHVPGHAPDHLVLVAGGAAFTGDAVLGAGSGASACARCTPATGPSSRNPRPRSTSTSRTGWSASAASSPRSRPAPARRMSCSTRRGTRSPRGSGCRRHGRSRRTWSSCARRGACPGAPRRSATPPDGSGGQANSGQT